MCTNRRWSTQRRQPGRLRQSAATGEPSIACVSPGKGFSGLQISARCGTGTGSFILKGEAVGNRQRIRSEREARVHDQNLRPWLGRVRFRFNVTVRLRVEIRFGVARTDSVSASSSMACHRSRRLWKWCGCQCHASGVAPLRASPSAGSARLCAIAGRSALLFPGTRRRTARRSSSGLGAAAQGGGAQTVPMPL